MKERVSDYIEKVRKINPRETANNENAIKFESAIQDSLSEGASSLHFNNLEIGYFFGFKGKKIYYLKERIFNPSNPSTNWYLANDHVLIEKHLQSNEQMDLAQKIKGRKVSEEEFQKVLTKIDFINHPFGGKYGSK